MADMVRCKLRRTYGYQGQYYGPGDNVLIPADLQMALGAQFADAPNADVPVADADEKKAKK